jgi:hypothetical protein
MSCNIVFDFVSPHNNEHWYRCTTCGATDWFAYYGRPAHDKPIKGCNPEFVATPINTSDPYSDLESMTREQLMGQIIRYRRYIEKLEQFQEEVYECYPDCSYDLIKMRQQNVD